MPEDTASVYIFPGQRIVGFNGRNQDDVYAFPSMSLSDALLSRHDTDAHAVAYHVPGEEVSPRLNGESLSYLVSSGAEPMLSVVFVDVDNPGHDPWTGGPSGDAACAGLAALLARAPTGAGGYTTRAGARLVWRLREPLPARRATAFLDALIRYLVSIGIPADSACKDWTRLYRLPYVVRDGVAQSPIVALDSLGFLDWTPPVNLRESPSLSADVPMDVAPPEDAEWDRLLNVRGLGKYLPKLREGLPLAKEGSRDTTLVKVIAAVADALGTPDARRVFAVVVRSVLADTSEGAPTVEKAWNRCQHFAAKHADRERVAEIVKATPLVVYVGDSYYVLNERSGGYEKPVKAAGLCQQLEQYCPSLARETRTDRNAPLATPAYLAAYGRPAHTVVLEIGRAETTFDSATGTLYEAAASPVDVNARYHPDVDQWLRFLGGASSDRLLDWLATCLETDRPTCALYLQGRRGCGKTMLAECVASLWGVGASSYEQATAAFNGALAANPVVLADESMTNAFRSSSSADFRRLISATSRTLTRKYLPAGTLKGAIRLVITANDGHALGITNETLNRDSLEAIAERILWVPVSARAANYLVSLGGMEGTAEWIWQGDGKPGKVAEHIHWLSQNRQVKRGSRYLVEGALTEFHTSLTLATGDNPNILAVAAMVLNANRSGETAVLRRGDKVYINSNGVRNAWPGMLKSLPPSLSAISTCLESLSVDQCRETINGRQSSYWVLPLEYVRRTAERLQIGDPDHSNVNVAANAPR